MLDAVVSSNVLKTAAKGLVAITNEARVFVDDKGLHSRAVDPANVAMVIVDIPREAFDVYKAEEDVLGVDILRLHDFSKSLKNVEPVNVRSVDGRLVLSTGRMRYSFALIDPSAIRKEPKLPNLDLPAKIVLDAGEFKRAISEADRLDDEAILATDGEHFRVCASDGVVDFVFELSKDELVEFNGAEAFSKFSTEYLREFVKIASKGDKLTIRLGSDLPARFVFETESGVTVEYVLAPRLEVQ